MLFFIKPINAQQINSLGTGFQCAAVFDIGSHVRQVGLKFAVYTNYKHVQLNLGTRVTYNSLSFGERRGALDSRSYVGLVGLWGNQNNMFDFEFDELNHQTAFSRSFGYSYIWYCDKFGTSQRAGAFSFSHQLIQVKFENDLLAGQGRDRFRTGALVVSRLQNQLKYHLAIIMWTGETRGSVWNKQAQPTIPRGYRDLSLLPYGKTSHGLIVGGITGMLDYGQAIGLKLGVDSEQIRHVIQNKLMHDLVFLPQFISRKTPHYPRVGANGLPIFDASLRKADRIFMQAGFGQAWSY